MMNPFNYIQLPFIYYIKILKAGEYSTIDSAIMVAGAYFAGNYFGGELANLASSIGNTPQ